MRKLQITRFGMVAGAALLLSTAMVPAASAQDEPLAELTLEEYHFEPVAPGDVVSYQPLIHNSGTVTAEWIAMTLVDDEYARHATRFSNCLYEDDADGTSQAICEFEIHLAPGETARVPAETAVDLLVQPNVPDQGHLNANYLASGFDGPLNPQPGVPGDGPALELEKIANPGFESPSPDFANVILIAGPNPTDLAATGGEIAGLVGDQLTVEFGITNLGDGDLPALQPGEGPAPEPQVTITFPDGVTVLEILRPEGDLAPTSGCHPVVDGAPDFSRRNEVDGRHYMCFVSELSLSPGESWLFPFRVEIIGTQPEPGEVEVTTGSHDPDPDNNTAPITLLVSAAGDGGGGGLPATGAGTTLTVSVGLLAVLIGLTLYLVSRRRRPRFASEPQD